MNEVHVDKLNKKKGKSIAMPYFKLILLLYWAVRYKGRSL